MRRDVRERPVRILEWVAKRADTSAHLVSIQMDRQIHHHRLIGVPAQLVQDVIRHDHERTHGSDARGHTSSYCRYPAGPATVVECDQLTIHSLLLVTIEDGRIVREGAAIPVQ